MFGFLISFIFDNAVVQDLPVLLSVGPYLEPPLNAAMARRLQLLQSVSRRPPSRSKADPTLLCMLAALVELFEDGFRLVAGVRQGGVNGLIRSLFCVRLSNLLSPCSVLALKAGPKLEESFSRAIALRMVGHFDDPGAANQKVPCPFSW